jgi:hypothetical protein
VGKYRLLAQAPVLQNLDVVVKLDREFYLPAPFSPDTLRPDLWTYLIWAVWVGYAWG